MWNGVEVTLRCELDGHFEWRGCLNKFTEQPFNHYFVFQSSFPSTAASLCSVSPPASHDRALLPALCLLWGHVRRGSPEAWQLFPWRRELFLATHVWRFGGGESTNERGALTDWLRERERDGEEKTARDWNRPRLDSSSQMAENTLGRRTARQTPTRVSKALKGATCLCIWQWRTTQDCKGCRWRLEQVFCLFWFESVTRSCVSFSLIWAAELSGEERCSTKWQLLSHEQTQTGCSRVKDAELHWENDLLIHTFTHRRFIYEVNLFSSQSSATRTKTTIFVLLALMPNTIYKHTQVCCHLVKITGIRWQNQKSKIL